MGLDMTAGVYAASMKLRMVVADKLVMPHETPVFADGFVQSGGEMVALSPAAKDGELVAEDTMEYGDEVILLQETDPMSGPLKVKGIGELGQVRNGIILYVRRARIWSEYPTCRSPARERREQQSQSDRNYVLSRRVRLRHP